jgi:glycosyltransferase involved in cell wall biosynthesis/GT2 family glycosyltransferase
MDPTANADERTLAADTMRSLHIAYVSWEFPPQLGGGIGTYVYAMSRALAERGHRVTVITTTPDVFPHRACEGPLTVVRLPLRRASGPEPIATLRTWQNRGRDVGELLGKMDAAGRPDVVEFADYRGEGVLFLTTSRPEKRPLTVVRLHTPSCVLSAYNTAQPPSAALEEYEIRAIQAADRVVAPTRRIVDELRGRVPSLGDVRISPHPVAPAFLGAPPATAAEETFEILYVGRIEQRKGVETLIRAAPTILNACQDATITLVGGDTPYAPDEPSTRARLVRLLPPELRDRVHMPGPLPRPELLCKYRAARLCVFPSRFENFPNTCLEAMALGKAVVGSSRSGMADMIEEGVSGFVVPPDDPEQLAAAVTRVYTMSAPQRAAIGAAARRRVEARYAPSVVAADVERLYARLIEQHVCPPPGLRTSDAVVPPRVAVVIPCYNHGAYVAEAVESVRAQTYAHIDCVVVDDGSTDAATILKLEALKHDGVCVIRQGNRGLSSARNAGVRATDTPFFVPLDSDDRLEPTFVEKLLPPLLADAALGYCYSHVRLFGAADGVWTCPPYDPRRLLIENLSVATAVVRRAAFDLAGGYSTDMLHGFEDWDFWLALLSTGYHGRCVPEPLFAYRKHAGGSMLTKTQRRRSEMVRTMIRHHRALFDAVLQVPAAAACAADDDARFRALLAQAELDHIENSRMWRFFMRLSSTTLYRGYLRLRFGRTPDQTPAGDALQRLRDVKGSTVYRLIRSIKRSPPYRWYARRKYGDEVAASLK